MSELFLACLKRLGPIEGGYSNNKKDNGGETMYGVTSALARAYKYTGPMKDIPKELVQHIYYEEFWKPIKGDVLNPGLAEFLFDFAVNSSARRAVKALQQAVGALPDGDLGPKTLARIAKHDTIEIVRLIFVNRAKVFAYHEDIEEFDDGWFARLFDVTARYFIQGGCDAAIHEPA